MRKILLAVAFKSAFPKEVLLVVLAERTLNDMGEEFSFCGLLALGAVDDTGLRYTGVFSDL